MKRDPSGRIIVSATGPELVLSRRMDCSRKTAWRWITDSDLLDHWIGEWVGKPGVGRAILFTMTAEDEAETEGVLIEDCHPPRTLDLTFAQESTVWRIRLDITVAEPSLVSKACEVTLAMRLHPKESVSDVGPGWEYYLDRLVAAQGSHDLPEWADYFPSMRAYYENLVPEPPAIQGPSGEGLTRNDPA